MPDIQTALKNALSKSLVEWDDDDMPPLPSVQPVSTSVSAPSQNSTEKAMPKNLFPIRNNVTRETFNFIKNNPGSKRKEIITALDHMGFKEASTSSIMSQLCRTKQAHITNGLYYVDVDEYVPIKNRYTFAKQTKAKAVPVPVEVKPKRKYTKRAQGVSGIGALLRDKLEAMPNPVYHEDQTPPVVPERKGFVSLVRNRTPESIIDNMTVYQARELYDHLKKLFGG